MRLGKITKTEWLLLGFTGLFLCALLMLAAKDRARLSAGGIETAKQAPQESFMPEAAVLDLNSATEEELTTLPGIGEVLARRIVAYREEHGPFSSPEELMEVSGIGKATYGALADRVTVKPVRD